MGGGEIAGHELGASLGRSARRGGGGQRDCLGRFGSFGAKERLARVTEWSVWTVRMRKGEGGDRSRARGGEISGRSKPHLDSKIPIFGKLENFVPNLENYF